MKKSLLFLCLLIGLQSCTTGEDDLMEALTQEQLNASSNSGKKLPKEGDFPLIPGYEGDAIAVYDWVLSMQRESGLMESAEFTDFVSLYDNALSVILFSATGEFSRAERILDYFDARRTEELMQGGFFQARRTDGTGGGRRWMGDNAWLLIAVNHYHKRTGTTRYAGLAGALENYLRGLQQADGSIAGGFEEDGSPIGIVTEGNLTALYAVPGYDDFHSLLLSYLGRERFDLQEYLFRTGSASPVYDYALDLHALAYLILPEMNDEILATTDRYFTSQVHSQNGEIIDGYCFDTDQDVIWLEGSAQLGLAYLRSGKRGKSRKIQTELDKAYIPSVQTAGTKGLAYTVNYGTSFGAVYLWDHADLTPALSSSIWQLLLVAGQDPFQDAPKQIPYSERFWQLRS